MAIFESGREAYGWSGPMRRRREPAGADATGGSGQIASEAEVRQGLSITLPRLWRYGFVLSRQRDWADDLVQQTCLRALERHRQFQPGSRIDHWLFAILNSVWLNEVRSRRVRFGQGTVDAEASLEVDGAREAEAKVLAGQVMRLVGDLPEAQRAAVFLAYVEGLTYREVAAVLDVPVGTVMSRLAAARAKLADRMSDGAAK
ncbi:RNA polymerase sigma factor [Azospirillum sp. 412522]|nr:RNA polymerase sigma factor [Azospirillum sp. 412522]